MSSGKGLCSDIARLKYETLKAVGISDKNLRLVYGPIYDKEDKYLANHEVLLVNVDGQNVILNDNVAGGHFAANHLPHGGVKSADVFVFGKEGGSTVNAFGRFIPLQADSETGSKAYPTAFNERERYVMPPTVHPVTSRQSGDAGGDATSRCTTDDKFCIDSRDLVTSGRDEIELILQQIAEAATLRPTSEAASDVEQSASPTIPTQRRDSRSTALKKETSITASPTGSTE